MADPASRPRLMVIDDDRAIAPIVERFASRFGFDVRYESSGAEALAQLASVRPDVVLVDLQMPQLGGIDVLRAIRVANPDIQVILMTGHASVDSAIDAIKAGAVDYLGKPFDFERLEALLVGVRDTLERREKQLQVETDFAHTVEFHGMIGRSPVMQDVFSAIRRMAPHGRTILISGETGTGKELVARALHKSGPRKAKPILTVNCSAVVETLFESELFGHVRGAFTGATDNKVGRFEAAHQGTLFLDEAGELPLTLQPKLLRALEQGEVQRVGSLEPRQVDVRVIAATNRDLRQEAAAGKFRLDLFYRLSIFEILLPPLRDRREDIPYITAAFIRDVSKGLGRPIASVSPAAEKLLQQAPWPGNIRELRNVIERACVLGDGRTIAERDVALALAPSASPAPAAVSGATSVAGPIDEAAGDLLTTAQREQIHRVLKETNGNKAAAAKRLGVSRRSLYRWLERLDGER